MSRVPAEGGEIGHPAHADGEHEPARRLPAAGVRGGVGGGGYRGCMTVTDLGAISLDDAVVGVEADDTVSLSESGLDERQRAIVGLPVDASGVVIGAPGSGKTTSLVARVARVLEIGAVDADQVLVLTPTRQTATALRDRLSLLGTGVTSGPLARSMASFAFQIVRAANVQLGEAPPQLLTAGDQDRIIAELLSGDAADEEAGLSRWPAEIGAPVRASTTFRTEVRALLAECTELGIDVDELARLGTSFGVPVWTSAASFWREYRYALDTMRTRHRDAATLVREAAGLLASAPYGEAGAALLGAPARLRMVLVDDAQELTSGGITLLRALRARGVAVVAFGDPDIGSGSFRGASPALFAELCSLLGPVHVLDAAHRSVPALAHLTRTITQSIGAAGRVEHRRAPGAVPEESDAVRTIVAGSPFEEVDRIARVLREWRLLDEVPWARMAVVAHDTRTVASLQAELAAREVPTRAVGVTRPLGSERIVREMIGILDLGLGDRATWDAEALTSALLSPLGGLDAVGIRRLRARLRHAELAEGGTRPASELLREAMSQPASLLLIDTAEGRIAERMATTLARLQTERERGADAHELLWLVWDRARDAQGARLSAAWSRLSASRGPLAAEVDQALDALVALFDAAKRFAERSPGEGPEPFLHRIRDSDVPEDTLSAPEGNDVVAVLTPAAALGTEFDAVVIAGIQEGVWPNVRLRGSLLEGWRLAESIASFRAGRDTIDVPGHLDRRRAALADELRLLVRAVSRARSEVVLTAVADDDLTPSPLLAFFPEPESGSSADVEAGHPLTLRGLVAQHRRTLTTVRAEGPRRHAAGQLALLATAHVPGAPTSEWFGVAEPSSDGPLRDPERSPVPVSPSTLTRFHDCPLDWAIRALGGDTRSWSAGAGVILHAAMEEVPGGEIELIRGLIDERWGELDFEAPWLSRKEQEWAYLLADRLHRYLATFHAAGGRTVGAEARFRLAVELGDGPPEPLESASTRDADAADAAHADAPDEVHAAGSAASETTEFSAAGVVAEPAMEAPRVHVFDPERERPPGALALVSGSIDRVEVYPPGRGEGLPVEGERDRVMIVDLKTGRSELRVRDEKVTDDPQLAAYQLAFLEGLVPGADEVDNAGARLIVLSQTTQKEPHYRLARQAAMGPETRAQFLQTIVRAAWGMASPTFAAPIDAHCSTSRFGVCSLHTVRAVSAS